MGDSWHGDLRSKNREEIFLAGKKLFLEHNFLNVNIKDICNLAGISRVTFYKNFKTIDDLIFEVQIDILNSMTQFIKDKDEVNFNGIERLKIMLYSWVDYAKKYKKEMKFIILFDLYYEEYDSNKELQEKYEEFIIKESNNFIIPVINIGKEDGSLKNDLNSIKTGYYIFNTMIGLLQRMSYSKFRIENGIKFDDITTPVVEMIIDSIKE
ncbi:TetR/AcrR family transcriptional regulator [Clostridium sp. SHJSY1]|uniref:TetR/AcrR family transcriptional regulator n=1 Tax=Clostridium sp. SHJSY1 TaxID=2942483 RepID=UPI0028758C87|nr:TetR/AcrR family transcriptional regulator [Clostridium sp. SHJSY1]MDS0526134.1 TetR/AcrR family transcriptional regulator [Clostridium sp. SHJSY1]